MRFKIRDKVYVAPSLLKPTIRDYLRLANETEAIGRRWTQNDVFALEDAVTSFKGTKEQPVHPEMGQYIAFIMWAAFAVAGDPNPYDKAIDVSMEDFEFVREPEDHQEAETPTKARTKAGTARAAKRRVAKPGSPPKTSSTVSTIAS